MSASTGNKTSALRPSRTSGASDEGTPQTPEGSQVLLAYDIWENRVFLGEYPELVGNEKLVLFRSLFLRCPVGRRVRSAAAYTALVRVDRERNASVCTEVARTVAWGTQMRRHRKFRTTHARFCGKRFSWSLGKPWSCAPGPSKRSSAFHLLYADPSTKTQPWTHFRTRLWSTRNRRGAVQ